jgi:hypothetical protein
VGGWRAGEGCQEIFEEVWRCPVYEGELRRLWDVFVGEEGSEAVERRRRLVCVFECLVERSPLECELD